MLPFGLVGFFLIAVGILLFFIRRRSAAMQAQSVNWPTVPGTVTSAEVKSYRDKDDHNHNYYADVRYAYQVSGVDYTDNRVSWGGRITSRSPDDANAIVARYAAGAPVAVHYNPKKPKQAVLEPHAKGGLKNLTFIMAIFLVLGAIFSALALVVTD